MDQDLPGLPLPHLRKEGGLHATLQDVIPEAVPPAQPLQYPVMLGTLELPLSSVRPLFFLPDSSQLLSKHPLLHCFFPYRTCSFIF